LLGEATVVLQRIEADRIVPPGRRFSLHGLFEWAVDVLLVALIAWAIPAGPWLGLIERLFPPVMLLALLRIVPRVLRQGWTAWLQDRALLAILIGLGLLAGLGAPLIYGLAALLAACGILWPQGPARLTPS
ncbi:MAG: hypothetical protein ACK44O_08780, partial [Novosphingobium sp.]